MLLRELLQPVSRDEVLEQLLERLRARGWEVDDWHSGGVARTLLELYAELVADWSRLVPKIAEGGYLETAQGPWLDLVASSQYGLTREPGVFAKGIVRLTCQSGFGPYTVEAGRMWLATSTGLRYLATTGGVLPSGGTLDVEVQAEAVGSRYNVSPGTITTMITPLPGVTATNPPGWLLRAGADPEPDERLRRRCAARWAELGYGATRAAYEYWALAAHPSVTRVRVLDQHPRGQGTVDVVIYGTGGLGPDVVSAVDAYIQERRPVTADVLVYSATPRLVTVRAEVYVEARYRADAEVRAASNLQRYEQELGIGAPVYRAALIEQLMEPAGVQNVDLQAPAADVVLQATEVAVLDTTLTWVEV